MRPCFQFFDFCISYTNLCFYLQEVVIKKWFFHHFFLYDHYNQHQTNTESRDFVLIFSGKGLVNDLIIVNWSEFTKLTMRFYLLLAAQISGWRARCPNKCTYLQNCPMDDLLLAFLGSGPKGDNVLQNRGGISVRMTKRASERANEQTSVHPIP